MASLINDPKDTTPALSTKNAAPATSTQPGETKTPQEKAGKDLAQAPADSERLQSHSEIIADDSVPDASPKIEESSLLPFENLNKSFEGKSVIKELNTLLEQLHGTKQQLSAVTKEKEEFAAKLREMQGINNELKIEVAETRGNQAGLLDRMDKLLDRLADKDGAFSKMAVEKSEALKEAQEWKIKYEEAADEIRKFKMGERASEQEMRLNLREESLTYGSSDAIPEGSSCVSGALIITRSIKASKTKMVIITACTVIFIALTCNNMFNKGWQNNQAKELDKLLTSLDEKEHALSSVVTEKNELAEKLAKTSRVNQLLVRLDEKNSALSNITIEKNELVKKLDEATGINDQFQLEIQEARAGLLQATSDAAAAESTVASLHRKLGELHRDNESRVKVLQNSQAEELDKLEASLDEKEKALSRVTAEKNELAEKLARAAELNDQFESEIQEARAGLLQATSTATAADATVALLRKENAAMRGENESLQEQLKKCQDDFSKKQQEGVVPLSSTSSIGFDDVSTTTSIAQIPNGYRGFNWKNAQVLRRSYASGTGFEYGIVSGDYMAYNPYGKPCSISSATPFSVAGFHATAVFNKGLNVLVESFDESGNRVGSHQTTLGDPCDGPAFVDLRQEGKFEGLYKLKITTSGGIDAGLGYSSPHPYLAIDDVLVY